MNLEDQQPASRFQWNAGGWFGSQIGMTAWILVTAFVLYPVDMNTAIFVLLLFVFGNAIGTWMWTRRSRINPYKAIQTLVLIAGACSMAAVFIVADNGHWMAIQQFGGAVSARTMYLLILAMVAGLLLLFHFLQRQSVRSDGE